MKKMMLTLLLVLSVLVSCDLTWYDSTYITSDDAFENPKCVLETILNYPNKKDGVIRFPVIADAHCGRKDVDKGVDFDWTYFYKYLEDMEKAEDKTPLLMLGDILDNATDNSIEKTKLFFESVHEKHPEMEIIYTCGNHELQECMVEDWEARYGALSKELDNKLNLTGTYYIGSEENPDLMIYNINSAYRMFGRRQLASLERALEANEGKANGMKLITSHIPMASSKVNQTLFNFIIGDARERNEMLRLMYEYGPSFMLCGHHHKGDTFNHYSDHSAEFIFSAFHKKGEFFESQGLWYIFQIDPKTGVGKIFGFSIWDKLENLYGLSDDDLKKNAIQYYEFDI